MILQRRSARLVMTVSYSPHVARGLATWPFNLTKDSPADDTQPAFSPDGERIAFRSEREGGGIFLMGATGESVIRVSDLGYSPSWSPDGGQILVNCAHSLRHRAPITPPHDPRLADEEAPLPDFHHAIARDVEARIDA